LMVMYAIRETFADPWGDEKYDEGEDAATALKRALAYTGNPTLTAETRQALAAFSKSCMPAELEEWQRSPYRAMRQNALRSLILTSSDWHAS
jgi:hypothetical protein